MCLQLLIDKYAAWTSYFTCQNRSNYILSYTIISPLTKIWRLPTIALVCPKRTKGLRWRESTQVDALKIPKKNELSTVHSPSLTQFSVSSSYFRSSKPAVASLWFLQEGTLSGASAFHIGAKIEASFHAICDWGAANHQILSNHVFSIPKDKMLLFGHVCFLLPNHWDK